MTVTIGSALQEAYRRIAHASDTPTLDAQLLLAEILEMGRANILAHPERVLTPEEDAHFRAWVDRRAHGEPIAYILERRAFYDREFIVSPAVLIPRPETEHLLEAALKAALKAALTFAGDGAMVAADIGTGSGAIAVTFKANRPNATVYAVDLSAEALQVAQKNATTQNADVIFLQGDLLTPLIAQNVRVDLLMANLPYIKTETLPSLEVSKHEPRLALDGGGDGLDLVRRLLDDAPQVCRAGGLILLEIGAGQGQATAAYAARIFPDAETAIIHDYAGHDRVVSIRLAHANKETS